jgi:pimeloyl-ACP methyl ester carboxylesterase
VALEAGASGDARSVTALSPAGFWRNEASFAYTKRLFQSAAAATERLGPRASALSKTKAGRALMYGLLTSRPSRISPDHALGDFRGFEYARPALRELLGAATPFTDEIPMDVPVTIAWAARDLVLPRWQAVVAKQHLPHAEHITMRGVGHVPMFDNPEFVAKILLRGSAPAATVEPIEKAKHTAGAVPRRRAATA